MQSRNYKARQHKIFTRLLIGAFIIFTGILMEFVITRYNSNRSMSFRIEGENVQIYKEKKWQNFPIAGVNTVAEIAGVNGESGLTKDEYRRRLNEFAAADINVIRVCTVLSPAFYKAFFEYNLLTKKPLFLLHGIRLANQPNNYSNAYDDRYNNDFLEEIRRTVDVVNGKGVPRQGNQTGAYNLNISPYVIGYALFEDVDDDFILRTNQNNLHVIGFEGDYLYTVNASPYEAWLAAMCNYAISYEKDKYGGFNKLVSWTNWPGFENIRITEKFNAGILASRHLANRFSEYNWN